MRTSSAAFFAVAAGLAAIAIAVLLSRDNTVVTDNQSMDEMAELAANDEAGFPAIADSAIKDPDERVEPRPATLTVLESIAHDTDAFTQGLEFDGDRLFESTGLVGRSSLREVDPISGDVLRILPVPEVFAEGLTVVGDEIIQITWTDGVAYRWNRDDFTLITTHSYQGEGWGICDDDGVLRMSDGTSTLTTRDLDTFDVLSTVTVTFSGAPVERINELECVAGTVWANIWQTPLIIALDPDTGVVHTVVDASELRPPSTVGNGGAVLNGIAWDEASGTFLLSGKLWPETFRVRID